MIILKVLCFLLVCGDTVTYIQKGFSKMDCGARLLGTAIGTAARIFVLWNTAKYWLMA
jgi:hypothetical protein